MTAPCRIVVVGGGVWITQLVRLLGDLDINRAMDIVLVAQDKDRLNLIRDHCARLIKHRPALHVTSASLPAALEGAQICVLMLRAGGSVARDIDERFPEEFGMHGDEGLGLGGYANALRTLPVMRDIASRIRSIAADCATLNLVAPLGVTTRALHEAGVAAVGLCELPLTTEVRLHTACPGASDRLNYAGLNHLGWFAAEPPHAGRFLEAAVAAGITTEAVVARYGAVPLSYFAKIFGDRPRERSLGSTTRAQQLQHLSQQALGRMQDPDVTASVLGPRDMPWLDQVLVPVIAAVLRDSVWHGFANLPAAGSASWCADRIVVEGRAVLKAGHWSLSPQSPMSGAVTQFLMASAAAEDHIYQASMSADPRAGVMDAIAASPLPIPPSAVPEAAQAVVRAAGLVAA